ncbi:XrtA/PEP-CTERM system TPR-repeat protein PrsT [Massilia endophytica]|uniref:XrtA/PEP-CTERM system TPR-repeat protein PrsT n=1 Tax=Massilia endophytica TaxID=2899220 RepID=UPI001E39594B|nr:XrtA/PEP-CTERM system TPR-repeat protein PrsT [Massilia endophytica]UGQ48557.1 PEP-CTERM system TPR-repeat protein PrsT [Massilia endophytica]
MSYRTVLGTLPLLLLLAACHREAPADDLLADARRYRAQGDHRAAIIQLKNVLQQRPKDAATRRMLGEVYLDAGDALSAEKELRRARELGVPREELMGALGKALLMQGQFQRVLDEVAVEQRSAASLALRANALMGLKRFDEAARLFGEALRLDAGNAEARLGMARVAMVQEQPDAALQRVEEAIARNPKDADSLRLKGDLLRAQGQMDAARASYESILQQNPNNVQAHIDIANLLTQAGKFDEAKERIGLARSIQGSSLLVYYAQALLDFRQGRLKQAQEQLALVLKAAPEHLPSVLLAGAVDLALGSLTTAETHLRKFIEGNPGHLYAGKLLASALLRSNRLQEADHQVQALLKTAPEDVELLAVAGEIAMRKREFKQAADYFQQASSLKPEAQDLRLAHGISRLGLGETPRAIAELEHAIGVNGSASRAGVLLVLTQMRNKEFKKALESVDAMIAHGDNPLLQNLRGGVLLASGDVVAARAGFTRALELDPLHLPALDNLAQLDMLEKEPEAARQRYEAALARDKGNVQIMTALARIATAEGKGPAAAQWLERATKAQPENVPAAVLLGNYYLRTGEKQKALVLAQKLHATNPGNAEALALLAQAESDNGKTEAALESYGKLAAMQPASALPGLRMASLHLIQSRQPEAIEDLRKALRAEPGNDDATILLSKVLIDQGALNEAAALALAVQKRPGGAALGAKLEGDVLMAQQKPAEAAARYKQGLSLAPSGPMAIALHQAQQASGNTSEASKGLQHWLAEHPADLPTRTYYASALLTAGAVKEASEQYAEIVKRDPGNVIALNDLAWCYAQLKDERALDHAQRAHKLAPANPAVADTLAAVLLERGDAAGAVPLLKKALLRAPAAGDIRLRLAQALAKTGDRKAAREQCQQLLALPGYKRQDEVRALMARL